MYDSIPVVLIADDDPLLARALARWAHRVGLATVIDTTSAKVLELVRQHHPQLIMLDLHQAIDGRDLLAHLKQDEATRDIPVVIVSGDERQALRHECFRLGAADYVVKPLDTLFFERLARTLKVATA